MIPVGGEQHREDQRAVPVLCLGDRDLYPAVGILCDTGPHGRQACGKQDRARNCGD